MSPSNELSNFPSILITGLGLLLGLLLVPRKDFGAIVRGPLGPLARFTFALQSRCLLGRFWTIKLVKLVKLVKLPLYLLSNDLASTQKCGRSLHSENFVGS